MKYLYGDSSPSTLETNFIQSLRDTLDFGVQVLQAEQQMQAAAGRSSVRRRAADAELARLDGLIGSVGRTLEEVIRTAPESPTGRCAAAILRSAGDLKREEADRARAAFNDVLGKLDAQVAREREGCVKALEKLLLKQDLVESSSVLQLQLRGGTRYEARLLVTAPYGLEAVLDLDIPATHAFARPVRLDRFAEQLEMDTPEGGWLSRDTKMRPHRFDRYHILEASIGPDQMMLKLRLGSDGTGRGFDAKFLRKPSQVMLTRVDDPPKTPEQPLEVKGADLPKFLSLWDSLGSATGDLARARRSLAQAAFEGYPLKDHEKPSLLLERLVSRMTPIVQEIARRSPSPTELVLKRLVGDDRREEVFVSKEELRRKIEVLPAALAQVLAPLALSGPARPAEAKVDPPTNGSAVHPAAPAEKQPPESAPRPASEGAGAVVADAPAASEEGGPPPMDSARGQAEVFHKRGMARMKVGELAAALLDYDRALSLRPDYPEAYANRATARQSSGDVQGAVSDLEAALRLAPSGWKYRTKIEHLLEGARHHAREKA